MCVYQFGVVGGACPHALQVHHHQGPQVFSIMGSFSVCDHSRKKDLLVQLERSELGVIIRDLITPMCLT